MKYQQVTVDVWKMTITAISYLALAFAAWVLLRLVSACISLPAYLRKQQEEEEAEERRLLLERAEDEDDDEEEEEDDDDEEGEEEKKVAEEAGAEVAVPPTPRANRGRRRATLQSPDDGADRAGVHSSRKVSGTTTDASDIAQEEQEEKKEKKN